MAGNVVGLIAIGIVVGVVAVLLGEPSEPSQVPVNPPGDQLQEESGSTAAMLAAIGALLGGVGTVGTLAWVVLYEITSRRATRDERRKAQASGVYAWLGRAGTGTNPLTTPDLKLGNQPVFIGNRSGAPVFDVVLHLVWVQGSAGRTGEEFSDALMRRSFISMSPGIWKVIMDEPNSPPNGVLGVELAFTDGANVSWVRRATGELVEIEGSPAEHYGIELPRVYSHAAFMEAL
ncbi:hypothetical protein [Rhodococcus coprophilus]|uniref:hypothetical protein n=1 Tax=Rhodococcus coprophilus TaxID=38310 RepID=UPI0033D0428B